MVYVVSRENRLKFRQNTAWLTWLFQCQLIVKHNNLEEKKKKDKISQKKISRLYNLLFLGWISVKIPRGMNESEMLQYIITDILHSDAPPPPHQPPPTTHTHTHRPD